jgi:hypothetical protein
MTPDARRMKELAPPPHSLSIAAPEVARLARCGPEPRWEREVAAGIVEARTLIQPRARWSALSGDAMDGLFSGGTPVEEIARRGVCWAFVATIGEALEARVREQMKSGQYLSGVLLDAAGSMAVEAVCDLVERACAGENSSSRYSPGYCMWRLESQRPLFALLRPEEIGIRLMTSMLMHPLKSVSGIVVKAPRDQLIVPAEFCRQCDATECPRRSATREGGEH